MDEPVNILSYIKEARHERSQILYVSIYMKYPEYTQKQKAESRVFLWGQRE